jgi:FAD/FMN-containing dehydrogenase
MAIPELKSVSVMPTDWISSLCNLIGKDAVVTDANELAFYEQDVFAKGASLSAVVVPATVADVQASVKAMTNADVAVIARGGGLSYTDGFLATVTPSALLDISKLNKLVELNIEDRYVTVETGMTWAALDEVLEPLMLRTPYWGPLSGLRSTVGGALSQGSVFLGSGLHGSVGDSVLSMDVVLADGSIITTGSAAAGNATPFMRYFGPDMTGVFIGDAGALGVKVRATLGLIPRPTELDFLSFEFDDCAQMLAAMSEVSRQGLASECFAFDPVLMAVRKKRMSMMSDAKTLLNVVKQSGVRAGLGLITAGRDFVGADKFSVHVVIEGENKADVATRLEKAKTIMSAHGKATENSFPKALRAMPFTPPNSMLGPDGERWVPVHGIFPHSKSQHAFAELQKFFASKNALLAEHKIRIGYLMSTIAHQATLIEPVFYWSDGHTEYHKRVVEADYLKKCGEPAANPSATKAVAQLKRETADLMRNLGCTHFQIGKFYSYREGRNPASLALFDAIKVALDPKGLMNPGVLK